jgi:hypothetical protein
VPVPRRAVTIARKFLIEAGYQVGDSSRGLDEQDTNALLAELTKRQDELHQDYQARILSGNRSRLLTAYIQLLAKDQGIDPGNIDGLWGILTEEAFDQLEHFQMFGELPAPWRDESPVIAAANDWPEEDEPALIAYYGQPGTNLTTIDLPYTHRLAWDLTTHVRRTTCNEKSAESIQRVLKRVLDHYGTDRIRELRLDRYGGCFNKRKKRGGTSWSMHAWGIALDYDPERNKLKWGRDRAAFARPEYNQWWQFWEEEGWTSLGRTRNFDWMHVQATKAR